MRVARGDAVALTRELVRIDSRNPSLVRGRSGRSAVARALAEVLDAWGFRVEVVDAAPGRPNVIARIGNAGRAHADVQWPPRRRRHRRDDARAVGREPSATVGSTVADRRT